MDREANLPPPVPDSSIPLLPLSDTHPTTATATATATTSSSSDSPPCLLRYVQAAFKRHRPLGTMQPNNVIRPRRILLPQRGPLKTPPCDATDDDHSQLDCEKRLQFSLPENHNSHRAGADVPMPTTPDFISSHFSSLSLTEMELDVSSGLHEIPPPDDHKHHQLDMSEGAGPTPAPAISSSFLPRRSNFPAFLGKDTSNPMTQSSVVGSSSCATTTSLHSKSAPNFTTSSSRPPVQDSSISHMDVEPMEALFNVNPPQPMSQGDPVHTAFKSTGVMLADSSAAHTQASISSLETPLAGVKDNAPPKEHIAFASKESHRSGQGFIDDAKGSSHIDDKSTKAKGYQGDVTDVQSQAPMTKTSSTNTKLEPPTSSKVEKAVSSKGASGSRKKNYDPDLFFKVNGKLYQKLGKIGSGGSSEVYKVISADCTIYALKKIKLKGRDYSTAYGFCQEIEYLNKLKGKKNIIQLIDYEVTDKILLAEVMHGSMTMKDGRIRDDEFIYVVLEYGEIDLAHMLSQKWKEMDSSDWNMDENWLRFYWQQILQAVNTIHEERIVHSDLKPANFLLVRGALKLIDFGIAKAIMSDTTNIQRDSQVGTLSYMSPEAFMCNENDANGNTIKCGRPSDIWSLGCILYQMVYGRTPFSEYKTFWAKFKVITNRNHEITYGPVSNPWLLDLMKKCLAWERNDRWRIPELLQHPFLVPPVTPPPPTQDQGCKLFEKIVEVYGNDKEVSRLCSQLQELAAGRVAPQTRSSDVSTERGLLSQFLRLCSKLHQYLTDAQKEDHV